MKPSGCELGLVLLVLTVLADWARAADCLPAQGDAHSLCSILNVSASGPSWCEFLGTIHRTPFLKYSCNSGVAKPVGPIGMMLNATEAWHQQCELWTELLPEFQEALLDNKNYISKAFDSLSLQGSMICEWKFGRCHKLFWEFGFKGQMCLRFDSKNRSWTELHPGCSSLKETLDSKIDISKCLSWISNENCVKLLYQSTVLDTKAAPTTAPASASSPTVSATPTTATATVPAPSKAMDMKTSPWIPFVIAFFLIGIVIICCIIYSRIYCSKAPESGSTSTRVPSGRLPFHSPQALTYDQELQPL